MDVLESVSGWTRRLAQWLNAIALGRRRRLLLSVMMMLGLVFGAYCIWLVLAVFR